MSTREPNFTESVNGELRIIEIWVTNMHVMSIGLTMQSGIDVMLSRDCAVLDRILATSQTREGSPVGRREARGSLCMRQPRGTTPK
jgi:hypothetical protein